MIQRLNHHRLFLLGLLLLHLPLRAQVIPPGFDLLETDPASTYDDLNLPPGTFLPFCDAGFVGRVYFKGSPIDCYSGVCNLAPTDTIVQRMAPALPPSATIPIEIVALELRSVSPITVNCTGGPQTWNVSASVPQGDTNQTLGSMTINQNYARGGTFTSTLPVRPYLTFTRVADNVATPPMLAPTPIIFQVSTLTTWCRRPNPVNDPVGDVVVALDATTTFFPGILCPSSPGGGGKRKKVLTVEQAALAAHGILPAEKKHHYKCFDITGPPLGQLVTLQDQFGTQNAQVMEPRYLCPPAIKNHQYGSLDSPHLKCYGIQPLGAPPVAIVDLDGQFGYEKNVPLGPASMLCTPANKQVISPNPTPPPVAPPPASPHYTCYTIGGPLPPPISISLETQFGLEPNDFVGAPRYLCAPTIKTVNSVSFGSLKEPHLKCYDITPPDFPPHIVSLYTQFGVEPNIPVGPSKLVCIPVNKRPTECNSLRAVTKISWSATTVNFSGAQYNAYKGDLQTLSSGYGTCLLPSLISPLFQDPLIPTPGRGFFYLINASIPSHDGPVEGTLGYRSSGVERANVDSCSP